MAVPSPVHVCADVQEKYARPYPPVARTWQSPVYYITILRFTYCISLKQLFQNLNFLLKPFKESDQENYNFDLCLRSALNLTWNCFWSISIWEEVLQLKVFRQTYNKPKFWRSLFQTGFNIWLWLSYRWSSRDIESWPKVDDENRDLLCYRRCISEWIWKLYF